MNYRAVLRYTGLVLEAEAIFMLPALFISYFCGESASAFAFLVSAAVSFGVGFIFARFPSDGEIYAREGFVTVALGWILLSVFGALPFFISREIPHFIDCWFETVSGFTTTGASILPAVESLPKGILYWRSFTHWLGGMGVLVFLLAIAPLSRGNGEAFHILRAESPGPSVGKIAPTIRQTSRVLYSIYIVLTVIEVIFLLFGGMPLFDAVCNSFATAGTGGFAIKNLSIGAYDSVYLQAVIGIFMVMFGINFNMYYLLLMRRLRTVARNEELRLYSILLIGATLIIGLNIMPMYENNGRAFLDSFFQVSSIMTTTGFATANFDLWPELSRFLLVVLMIIGASAGSTGGGVKVSRIIIVFKYIKREMQAMLRPRSVRGVYMDKKKVDDGTVRTTLAFIGAYCIICIVSMLFVAGDNFDMETTVTSVFACINNIGPGLSLVGPMSNYSAFSYFSKIILSVDMLFGRLEIFPLLMLFFPTFWKKRV